MGFEKPYKKVKLMLIAFCCIFTIVHTTQCVYAQNETTAQSNALLLDQLWPLKPSGVVNSPIEITPGPYLDPSPVAPAQDPFVSVKPSLGKSIFVYAPLSTTEDYGTKRYFVLRGNQIAGTVGAGQSAIATYGAADSDGMTFDPLFSPNGRSIAFKSGDKGDDHSRYNLFLWDTDGRKIIKATKRLIYFQQVSWCPDSQKIAFVTGGNSLGDPLPGDSTTALDVYDEKSNEQKTIVSHPVVFLGDTFNYHGLKHFHWINKNTLIYSRLPEVTGPKGAAQPNIYEADLQTLKQTKIVDDAYAPNPSPDGRWIAFLSYPRKADQKEESGRARQKKTFGLYLLDKEKNEIHSVSELQVGSTSKKSMSDLSLKWTPDSSSS